MHAFDQSIRCRIIVAGEEPDDIGPVVEAVVTKLNAALGQAIKNQPVLGVKLERGGKPKELILNDQAIETLASQQALTL